MAKSVKGQSVLELQTRWDRIRIANLYDALDPMGFGNQCLDLGIKPLFPGQHLAGMAVTIRGGRDPRSREEIERDAKDTAAYMKARDLVYPGSVVVVECGGETYSGKFGEMTSWSLKQRGARGIVLDSYIRDLQGLEIIPDYAVCARGTSPVESYGRWRPMDFDIPIALPGTLTNQVRINPGDWIVGDADGVIIVPQEIAMEALVKAEDIEDREQGMREDLAAGMSFDQAFEKWGRA